jgi:hypothetical protein
MAVQTNSENKAILHSIVDRLSFFSTFLALNHTMTITCMGCEAYIDDDLLEDPWYESWINSYLDITDEDTDKHYVMVDEEEVWSLVYDELDLSPFNTPLLDFPTFDHFVARSAKWSFLDRHFDESTLEEYDEEYAQLLLDW